MRKAERQKLVREIAQELDSLLERKLRALGMVPSATATAEEENMTCESKDPTNTETAIDAALLAKADAVGVRFARMQRQRADSQSGRLRPRNTKAG